MADSYPAAVSVSNILKEEGFARLPKRKDDERPAGTRPTVADVADVRQLDLETQTVGFYSNWRSFFAKNYPKHCLDLLQSIPPSYFSKYRLQRSGHIQS
jgi:hypothetical protein